jgi:Icc-related predicted phosphoesterase
MTKIVATSDFHGKLPFIPECDILLIAGDICSGSLGSDQGTWLETKFRPWLDSLHTKHVVAIAGNHDHIFETTPHLIPKDLKWHYLQDSFVVIENLTIYGTPWQLPFWGAFNLSDGRLEEVYKKIPDNADIIISHGPPQGIKDEIIRKFSDSKTSIIHTGSLSLRKRVLEIKPKLCVFGHIHEAYGKVEENGITFANVSLVDDELKIAHEPMVFEL